MDDGALLSISRVNCHSFIHILKYTIKQHFYAHDKFVRVRQSRPLDKFMQFLFMRSSALSIVAYGTIKIYAVKIYATCA